MPFHMTPSSMMKYSKKMNFSAFFSSVQHHRISLIAKRIVLNALIAIDGETCMLGNVIQLSL
jgi:hypothetical protein